MGTWVFVLVKDEELQELKLWKILLFPVMDIAIEGRIKNREKAEAEAAA